jgi:hypothetical protein
VSGYRHTQTAPRWTLAVVLALALLALSFASNQIFLTTLIVVAAVFLLLAACFQSLTVEDEGDQLALRYGPLPLIRKRFAYADMSDIAAARSKAIDGWGIHLLPGRGWTYNLWGYGCVELLYRGEKLRIGTDDAENLCRFLRERAPMPGKR